MQVYATGSLTTEMLRSGGVTLGGGRRKRPFSYLKQSTHRRTFTLRPQVVRCCVEVPLLNDLQA